MGAPVRVLVPPPKKDEVSFEEIEQGPSDQEIKDEEKLQDFQEQFGEDDYTIRIQKYNDEERELEYVDKVRLNGFDPFVLGKRFGGGRYVCTLFNDKGKYVEGGRFHFKFAKPSIEEKKEISPFQDPAVLMVIEQTKQTQAMLMEILKTSLTGEKQTPVAELIQGLKGLSELSPKEKTESPFKIVKEIMEIQNYLRDSGEESNEKSSGILSEVLQALKTMGQMRVLPNMNQPQRPVSRINPQGSTVITRTEEPIKEVTKEVNPILENLNNFIPSFTAAAKNGEDPEKWAQFLLDIVDLQVVPLLVKQYGPFIDEDQVWEKLIAASENESEVNKIYQFAPDLEPYRDWVGRVLQAAVKLFDGDEEMEESILLHKNGDDKKPDL